MLTLYERYIRPAFMNFSWQPSREWVIVLAIVAILVNGANDVIGGNVDLGTSIEVAITAIFALLARGQTTTVAAPMDNDGRALVPLEATE